MADCAAARRRATTPLRSAGPIQSLQLRVRITGRRRSPSSPARAPENCHKVMPPSLTSPPPARERGPGDLKMLKEMVFDINLLSGQLNPAIAQLQNLIKLFTSLNFISRGHPQELAILQNPELLDLAWAIFHNLSWLLHLDITRILSDQYSLEKDCCHNLLTLVRKSNSFVGAKALGYWSNGKSGAANFGTRRFHQKHSRREVARSTSTSRIPGLYGKPVQSVHLHRAPPNNRAPNFLNCSLLLVRTKQFTN